MSAYVAHRLAQALVAVGFLAYGAVSASDAQSWFCLAVASLLAIVQNGGK